MRAGFRLGLGALLLGAVACQEHLAAPGECPGVCPGGRSAVYDTVLTAAAGQDSTFGPVALGQPGYVAPGAGSSLRVSSGLDGRQERAIVRFIGLPDSVLVNDTLRPYTIDSVALSVTVLGRDPAASGLSLELYRLPAPGSVDSTTSFAAVEGALTPGNLLATLPIADTASTAGLRVVFTGATLAAIQIPPADSGVLALAYRLAPGPVTGVRLGSASSASPPSFITYITTPVVDTALQHQVLPRIVAFSSFVSPTPQLADAATLTSGGAPSARALVRFTLPPFIRDSSTIIRATLELTPLQPVNGLPGDTVAIDLRALLSDLGAKSPRLASSTSQILLHYLTVGESDTLRIDVTSLVTLWQPPNKLPAALFLALQPEGSSFTQAVFGSTRMGAAPRLRLTYVLPYPFETP